jgi:hypothetical protein
MRTYFYRTVEQIPAARTDPRERGRRMHSSKGKLQAPGMIAGGAAAILVAGGLFVVNRRTQAAASGANRLG